MSRPNDIIAVAKQAEPLRGRESNGQTSSATLATIRAEQVDHMAKLNLRAIRVRVSLYSGRESCGREFIFDSPLDNGWSRRSVTQRRNGYRNLAVGPANEIALKANAGLKKAEMGRRRDE